MSEMVGGSEVVVDIEPAFEAGDEEGILESIVENLESYEDQKEAYDEQEVINDLVEYYGDQWFNYLGREGDIVGILNSCSAIIILLKLGPDFIKNMLNPYMVEKPVEQEDPTSNKNDVADEQDDGDRQDDPKETQAKDSPDIVAEKELDKSQPQQKHPEVTDRRVEVKVVAAAQPRDISDKSLVVKGPALSDVKLENIDSEIIAVNPSTAAVDELIEPKIGISKKAIAETVEPLMAEEIQQVEASADGIELADFIEDTNTDEALDAEFVSDDFEQEVPNDENEGRVALADSIDSWKHFAEDEVPLDELLITIVDQLSTETEEFAVENVNFDTDRVSELNSPEIEALVTQLESVKVALKRTYLAESKEDRAVHVNELVVTLTGMLETLGYDNPEKMIRDFLQTHPLATLQELIDALELSLRRSIQYELVQRGQVHHKRHSALGKLVQSVLRAISLRNPVLDIQA